MRNLSEYTKDINFEYAISYSGFRGEQFAHLKPENRQILPSLLRAKLSAISHEKSRLQEQIELTERNTNDAYNSRIVSAQKVFHESAIQIQRYEKNDERLEEILKILRTQFKSQDSWMCPPIFRDAIVFYSKDNRISGILHVCFSCESIKNEKEEEMEVDNEIFQRLKDKLIEVGHPIDE